MKVKKIALLGGSHFIGYHLMDTLYNSGHDVTIFNRGITDPPKPFPREVKWINGDRNNPKTFASLFEKEFDVVGTRPVRHDGADKVTGRAKYSADSHPTGFLHGKILRSPHAHARILSIDTSKALAHPGVRSVMTSADLPEVSAEIADLEEGAAVNYGFYSRNSTATLP